MCSDGSPPGPGILRPIPRFLTFLVFLLCLATGARRATIRGMHPARIRPLTLAVVLVIAVAAALDRPAAAQLQQVTEARSALDTRGYFVRAKGERAATFKPWTGEMTLNRDLVRLQVAGGGELRLTPGDYELQFGLFMLDCRGITLAGMPGARLVFAPEPPEHARLVRPAVLGATTLEVDRPDLMRPGWNYQLYAPDRVGDRLLEFAVAGIDGARIGLRGPVAFMGHVKEIPVGSIVVQELNALRLRGVDDVTIEGLAIDGRGRGNVRGHTTFSGVIASGDAGAGRQAVNSGLVVRGCTFEGLTGRGIAVYAMKGVRVEGCTFRSIATEALEIDHHSSGLVLGNYVERATVGIVLNDAFDTTVSANHVHDSAVGIAFVRHFDDPTVNRGLVVAGNRVTGDGVGISLGGLTTGFELVDNDLANLREARRVVSGPP